MKTVKSNHDDDLRPEYDLNRLRVRRLGPGRKKTVTTEIRLAPDVAKLFPDSSSVNEALRFLIRIANTPTPPLR